MNKLQIKYSSFNYHVDKLNNKSIYLINKLCVRKRKKKIKQIEQK